MVKYLLVLAAACVAIHLIAPYMPDRSKPPMSNKATLNKQTQAAELRVKVLVAELGVEKEKCAVLDHRAQAVGLRVKILVAELEVEQYKVAGMRAEHAYLRKQHQQLCSRLYTKLNRYHNVWYRRAWRWFAGKK